jgi:hypothetical protein
MNERFKLFTAVGSALACLILVAASARAETPPTPFETNLARAKAALAIAEKNGGEFASSEKPEHVDAQLFENLRQDRMLSLSALFGTKMAD